MATRTVIISFVFICSAFLNSINAQEKQDVPLVEQLKTLDLHIQQSLTASEVAPTVRQSVQILSASYGDCIKKIEPVENTRGYREIMRMEFARTISARMLKWAELSKAIQSGGSTKEITSALIDCQAKVKTAMVILSL
jgi:hypothetical protein